LNRKLSSLAVSNEDLMKQLASKDRQLQHFAKLLAPQEELANTHEKLKQGSILRNSVLAENS
jgi:hypothetical protein